MDIFLKWNQYTQLHLSQIKHPLLFLAVKYNLAAKPANFLAYGLLIYYLVLLLSEFTLHGQKYAPTVILSVIVFLIYTLLSSLAPAIGLLFAIGFLFLLPWIINQGLRFNMRMTRHRNVRFAFSGNYGDAFINFVLLPIASAFTLHLLLPYVLKRIDQYMHENISYGNKPLTVNLQGERYYIAALITLGVAIGGLVIFGIFAGASALTIDNLNTQNFSLSTIVVPLLIAALYIAFLTLVGTVYHSLIRNHIFNNSEFTEVATFESSLKAIDYAILLFTNVLAIMFTLGLAYPWAKVRRAKLLASVTEVTI